MKHEEGCICSHCDTMESSGSLTERVSGDSIRVVHPLFQAEGDGANPISPLQLTLNEAPAEIAVRLNKLWHSVLPEMNLQNLKGQKHSVCYTAEYKNRYYAVAMWTTPIAANRMKDGFDKLELRRLAIADDAPQNTASRMLKVMRALLKRKWPHIVSLVSYQAEDHHSGTIYKAAGWKVTNRAKHKPWPTRRNPKSRAMKHTAAYELEPQMESCTARWELCL